MVYGEVLRPRKYMILIYIGKTGGTLIIKYMLSVIFVYTWKVLDREKKCLQMGIFFSKMGIYLTVPKSKEMEE